MSVEKSEIWEPLLKGKATLTYLDQVLLKIEKHFFTKQATLVERSIVPRLPL